MGKKLSKAIIDRVASLLEVSTVPTTKGIATDLGISRTTAVKYMAELERSGVVKREKAGPSNLWRLSPDYKAIELQGLTGEKTTIDVIDCSGVGCIYPKTSRPYGKAILKRIKNADSSSTEFYCSLGNNNCRELKNYVAQQEILRLLKKN